MTTQPTTRSPGFLLLHSPLVGPGTWKPVAEALRAKGHRAATPDLRLSALEPPYYPALAERIAAAGQGGDIVVAHSGAGALAGAARAPLGVVFVDALLPHPGRPWLSTVAPQMADQLAASAAEGLLPSWNTWLPEGALERLLPDPAVREAFLAELEPTPLAYFQEDAPRWPGVDTARAAYLQLSEAYAAEATQAAGAGSHVVRLPGHHLSMLTDAGMMAEALVMLAARWAPAPAR